MYSAPSKCSLGFRNTVCESQALDLGKPLCLVLEADVGQTVEKVVVQSEKKTMAEHLTPRGQNSWELLNPNP